MRYIEQTGEEVIAAADFYQGSGAMNGASAIGAQDNDMLRCVVSVIANSLKFNDNEGFRGPTGREK